jgi:hypothetical protein
MGPFRKGPSGVGVQEEGGPTSVFGPLTPGGEDMDAALQDAREFLSLLEQLAIRWVCVTAGSPYYNPHMQRPAMFPPSDGYLPPEDPLVGVARQIDATARLKRAFPSLAIVGSAYSYLQDWLPNVAQHAVANSMTDFVGLGRMVLSYPDLPADVLAGRPLQRKFVCRTFSDCTTGPRLGLVSGCYPLDDFYKSHPHAERLKTLKAEPGPLPTTPSSSSTSRSSSGSASTTSGARARAAATSSPIGAWAGSRSARRCSRPTSRASTSSGSPDRGPARASPSATSSGWRCS